MHSEVVLLSPATAPAEDRIRMALRLAAIIRERKYEFNAWLVFEAGKTWPEAEAEVAEAIDRENRRIFEIRH